MIGTKQVADCIRITNRLRGVQNMMGTKQITQTTNTLYV